MEPDRHTSHSNIFKRAILWLGRGLFVLFILTVLSVLSLRWVDPPTSSYMMQQQWSHDDNFSIDYRWVDWNEISDYVKVAAITSEDQRFPEHFGIDWKAVDKALQESRRGEELRGASTITQQVAKNLYLWSGRSFIRKGAEAGFAMLIELFWSKKRILEVYLNIAEFGPGVFGVEAAAQSYFNTSAANLDMPQSALMITALPSPKRYNLADPSPYMIERRNWILRYMHLLGNRDLLKRIE